MTVMEEVVCKARELADTVGKKTGEFVSLGKLKLESTEIERDLEAQFREIGKLVYNAHQNGETVDEALAVLFEQVQTLQEKATHTQSQMEELRHVKKCGECGNANPQNASFCQKCGKKL